LRYLLLGVRSDKGHQADDWLGRPLRESQLQYAASDVHELPALTEILTERAELRNRLALVFQASHEALEPSHEPRSLGLESFRNAWQLGPRSQAGLRFLIQWYNQLSAEDKLAAPDTKTLLALAARMPESADALGRIKGVAPGLVKRQGEHLVRGLKDSALQTTSADFVPIEPLPYATFAETRCEAWLGQLRAEICENLVVSPEHVLPARVVRELKSKLLEGRPVRLSDALRGYRKQLLGDAVDEYCARHPPPSSAA
jgi:ribonuclease D